MNLNIEFECFGRAVTDGRWVSRPQPNIGNLYYVISGCAYYIQNGIQHKMLPGHIYMIPASLYVERHYEKGEPFVHLFFDYTTIPVIKLNEVLEIDARRYPALYHTAAAVSEFFFSMRNEKNNYMCKPESEPNIEIIDIAKSYFYSMLMLIDLKLPLDTVYDNRIADTIQYIHDNYMNDIPVQELADRLFLEKNYFIKLFKTCMNTTPHNYIRNHRINMAISMLRKGASIKETAHLCGFKSESAFSSVMKKVMCVSPSTFQTQN